jgi:hypothetical protein
VFVGLSFPQLELKVYPPSQVETVNLTPGSGEMSITWSRPDDGDYQVYVEDTPSNAITFTITRDDQDIDTVEQTIYQDTGLSFNQTYNYRITAESDVGSSLSDPNTALTKPGVPIFTSFIEDINSIDLIWEDPVVTGV